MKTKNFITILVCVVLLSVLSSGIIVAQDKMTKDEWKSEMAAEQAKLKDLQTQSAKLTAESDSLKALSSKMDADVRSCEDALYAMLGVTRADVEAFDKELTDMESRVSELQRMSDEELMNHKDEIARMDTRLGEMSKSKIALIPRYGQRVQSLQDRVNGLKKSLSKEKTYVVGTWSKNRDCLWNIAKKKDIYANAWMWPKIWQGNRDKIKDPDVIKPKWVLKIPEAKELSKEEKSSANSYYRKKASAPSK